jgi:hypothetical protein
MMTDQTTGWIHEPFDSPVDVDLSAEGPQWQHHLSRALSERVPHGSFAGSRKFMDVPRYESFECREYEARDSDLRSRLWVTVKDRWILIAGDGPQDDAQIAPWVEAVLAAKARMADEHPRFR